MLYAVATTEAADASEERVGVIVADSVQGAIEQFVRWHRGLEGNHWSVFGPSTTYNPAGYATVRYVYQEPGEDSTSVTEYAIFPKGQSPLIYHADEVLDQLCQPS